jgi:sugar phosphate isomerase/epimerase
LCFHAPHRRPHNVAGFAGEKRAEIQADYAPMLDVATRFAPAPVVIHGAWSETLPHETLYADTVAFLEWVLERYPALTPALENLPPDPRRIKIGATRGEIRDIVEKVGGRRLGLCWDMGHDVVTGRQSTPDAAWLRHVVHVHLHDIDEHGTDHYPLLYGRTPYRTWLPALVQVGFKGIVTLEIKGEQLAHLGFEQVRQILAASVAEIARVLATPSP